MKRDKILIINPGSTSTKIAVYKNVYEKENKIFETNIIHSVCELSKFNRVSDQVELRLNTILKCLEEAGVSTSEFICVSARGGLLKPILGGTYEINKLMCDELKATKKEHASNLGAIIGMIIAEKENIRAFIVDPVVVDEMMPIAKITGIKDAVRAAQGHVLNQKAIARKIAHRLNKKYEECNIIVCHMGGGVSVGIHAHGKVIDTNNGLDGDGPMSPERAGSIPNCNIMDMIFEKGMTQKEVYRQMVGGGGLINHLGTSDAKEVEKMINGGNKEAKLVYEGMSYQISKEIGSLSVAVNGKVDAVALTGGIAYSKMMTDWIVERVKFIAPVYIYPGEGEIEALFEGAMRVMLGDEKALIY